MISGIVQLANFFPVWYHKIWGKTSNWNLYRCPIYAILLKQSCLVPQTVVRFVVLLGLHSSIVPCFRGLGPAYCLIINLILGWAIECMSVASDPWVGHLVLQFEVPTVIDLHSELFILISGCDPAGAWLLTVPTILFQDLISIFALAFVYCIRLT